MNLPVTGVDIQQAIIPLLQQNPLITSLYTETSIVNGLPDPRSPAVVAGIQSAMPQILDDDPLTVDQATGVAIALHLLAEDDDDGTLGGSVAGTRSVSFYLALIVYVFEANKAPGKKRFLAALTSQARAALMQNGLRMDPEPNPRQRWYTADFYKRPATVYQNGGGFRRSITFIEFKSRFRTL